MAQIPSTEHPSVAPWHELRRLVDPSVANAWEPLPDTELEEFLAIRREFAHHVACAALKVVDSIDQNPA